MPAIKHGESRLLRASQLLFFISYLLPVVAIGVFLLFDQRPAFCELAASVVLVYLEIGICMSVCLHRYFAHGAFDTSRLGRFVVAIVGCCAYQGGPLWWAGKHRRHHRHCDQPHDPHSVLLYGKLYAWVGWTLAAAEQRTDYEFLPNTMCLPELIVLNQLWFVPPLLIFTTVATTAGWRAAVLYVSSPMLLCRLATLWFNVAFHPASTAQGEQRQPVQAILNAFVGWARWWLLPAGSSTSAPRSKLRQTVPPCRSVDMVNLFAGLVGEDCHADHHERPARMCRPSTPVDLPYVLCIRPLLATGLIWERSSRS